MFSFPTLPESNSDSKLPWLTSTPISTRTKISVTKKRKINNHPSHFPLVSTKKKNKNLWTAGTEDPEIMKLCILESGNKKHIEMAEPLSRCWFQARDKGCVYSKEIMDILALYDAQEICRKCQTRRPRMYIRKRKGECYVCPSL